MDSSSAQSPTPAPAPAPAPAPSSAPAPAATSTAPASADGYISNPYALIKPSFEAFKLAWLNLLLMILMVIGATILLLVIVGVGGPIGAIIGFIAAIPILILGTGYVGFAFTKVLLASARGTKMSFKESLPTSIGQAWQFFATSFLAGLVTVLGLVLFVVPGLIFMTWFALSTFYVVDEGVWGVDALRRSRDLVRGRFWDVIGTWFMSSSLAFVNIIPILGPLVYFIFAIVVTPISAVRYVQLKQLKQRPDWDKVPTSPLNYVALVLGIVFTGFSYSSSFNKALENQTQQLQGQVENSDGPY